MIPAFVALGSNLGDPAATLRAALIELAAIDGCQMRAHSSLYRTAPVGLRDQPDFINAVALIDTVLAPEPLLAALFAIEARFGRRRAGFQAPRTLDLDLLLHGETTSNDPQLTLPHPRMHQRAFVLLPLLEIAPACVLPGIGPAAGLLAACHDQSVQRLTG